MKKRNLYAEADEAKSNAYANPLDEQVITVPNLVMRLTYRTAPFAGYKLKLDFDHEPKFYEIGQIVELFGAGEAIVRNGWEGENEIVLTWER